MRLRPLPHPCHCRAVIPTAGATGTFPTDLQVKVPEGFKFSPASPSSGVQQPATSHAGPPATELPPGVEVAATAAAPAAELPPGVVGSGAAAAPAAERGAVPGAVAAALAPTLRKQVADALRRQAPAAEAAAPPAAEAAAAPLPKPAVEPEAPLPEPAAEPAVPLPEPTVEAAPVGGAPASPPAPAPAEAAAASGSSDGSSMPVVAIAVGAGVGSAVVLGLAALVWYAAAGRRRRREAAAAAAGSSSGKPSTQGYEAEGQGSTGEDAGGYPAARLQLAPTAAAVQPVWDASTNSYRLATSTDAGRPPLPPSRLGAGSVQQQYGSGAYAG